MTRPDVEVMRDLLARVKAAEKPTYVLDCAIGRGVDNRNPASVLPPCYLGSCDAAIALFKRLLPGWSYCIRESGFGGGDATIHDPMRQPALGYDIRFDHPAGPCLALVGAVLTALIAAEGRDHG